MSLLTFDSGASVRNFQESDRLDLYYVCLATGDSGADASHLYNEKEMIGEIYVGPYLTFQPDLSFTLLENGVAGYALATLDTRYFEDRLAKEWWPVIQEKYSNRTPESFNFLEKNLLNHIMNPPRSSESIINRYPSHLHIDLLARVQGRGMGKAMINLLLDALREQSSTGVHLRMGAQNSRAFTFYTKLGFALLEKNSDEWVMGLTF